MQILRYPDPLHVFNKTIPSVTFSSVFNFSHVKIISKLFFKKKSLERARVYSFCFVMPVLHL